MINVRIGYARSLCDFIYSGKNQVKNRAFSGLIEIVESGCDKIVVTMTRNDNLDPPMVENEK